MKIAAIQPAEKSETDSVCECRRLMNKLNSRQIIEEGMIEILVSSEFIEHLPLYGGDAA